MYMMFMIQLTGELIVEQVKKLTEDYCKKIENLQLKQLKSVRY